MLASEHVAADARIWRHVAAGPRHAGGAQATLLLTWHARPIRALCCRLQQRLRQRCAP